jgi:hypothetical protein
MRLLSDVAVIGFVLALVSVPLALGWVPRNRLYGFVVIALFIIRGWKYANRLARQIVRVTGPE